MPLTLVKAESRGIARQVQPIDRFAAVLNADLTTAGVTGGAETVAGSVTAVMSGASVVSIAVPQALPHVRLFYI